jgi:hypothetical protein
MLLISGFRRSRITPKNVCAAAIGATLLAWSSLSIADEYRPDQFLGLDLSQAALSPKPLGPPSKFEPVQIEAKGDQAGGGAQANADTKAEAKIVKTEKIEIPKVAETRVKKPRGAARAKLARRHSNPLDAQAFDTRIQVWPCRSGGICNWKR